MQKQPAQTYKVILGSNTISNCGSVIKSRGKSELLRLRDGKDLKLLADCTVKNSNGDTIIKVANNKPVFINETLQYEELENGLIVKDKETGKVYLEFRQLGPREVKVNGIFFINGVLITATDEYLDVRGNRLSHNTFDNCGSALGV